VDLLALGDGVGLEERVHVSYKVTLTSSSYQNVFVNVQHRNDIILDVMAVYVQMRDHAS
jgi:hypothetical protein